MKLAYHARKPSRKRNSQVPRLAFLKGNARFGLARGGSSKGDLARGAGLLLNIAERDVRVRGGLPRCRARQGGRDGHGCGVPPRANEDASPY